MYITFQDVYPPLGDFYIEHGGQAGVFPDFEATDAQEERALCPS
jgi:hypothetical protein